MQMKHLNTSARDSTVCGFLSLATSVRSGSSQPSVHSTWESRNVKTDPVAAFAPTNLALMSPSLSTDLRTFTVTPSPET